MASVVDREAQCGRRTKINWTKTAHNTCICGHIGLVSIHTHTPLCGYGLSIGPTEGLSSWWLRNQSPPDSGGHIQKHHCCQGRSTLGETYESNRSGVWLAGGEQVYWTIHRQPTRGHSGRRLANSPTSQLATANFFKSWNSYTIYVHYTYL